MKSASLISIYWFGMGIFICTCFSVTNGVERPFYKFQRRPQFDHYKCHYTEEVLRVRGLNDVQCLMRCLSARKCYTAFNLLEEQKCTGCKKVYQTTEALVAKPVYYRAFEFVPVCPSGWVGYQRSCYKLSSPGTFDNGANQCEQADSRAVYIETEEENEFLKSFILADGTTWGYFIGMTNCDSDGVWKFHNTNTNATFLDFEAREGNDPGACCSLFYTGFPNTEWADWSCTQNPFPTICEKEINVIV